MSNNTLTPPDEFSLCRTTQELLDSDHFRKFLDIYNLNTAATRANKENVSVQDVLRDRNLRNRMRAFFREQIEIKLTGAKHANAVVKISALIDKAAVILDERNQRLRRNEIIEDSADEIRLLNKCFEHMPTPSSLFSAQPQE